MFKVLILVCAAQVAPQDCQMDNAADVIWGPDAANEMTCAHDGQAYIADTAIAAGIGQDHYVKVQCVRPQAKAVVTTDDEAGTGTRPDRHVER